MAKKIEALGPATLVAARYPFVDRVPLTTMGAMAWYRHQLPNGRIAAIQWLYEADKRRRVIIVTELEDPTSPVLTQRNVFGGWQASKVTNQFLDQLAALPPKAVAA